MHRVHFLLVALVLITIATISSALGAKAKQQRGTSAGLQSPEMAHYHGSWRHVHLPHHGETAAATGATATESSSSSSDKVQSDVAPAFSLQGGVEGESSSSQALAQQDEHSDEWPDDEPFAASLDLTLPSLKPLFEEGAQNRRVALRWKNVAFDEKLQKLLSDEKDGDESSNKPVCTARLVSENQQNDDTRIMPRAVEFSCTGMNHVIDAATRNAQRLREQLILQREQDEELREFIERTSASNKNNKNNRNKKKKKKKSSALDPDFDPDVAPFDFLKWNSTSLMFPVAHVAMVVHEKQQKKSSNNNARWFEGAASACVETMPLPSASDWTAVSKSNKQHRLYSAQTGKMRRAIQPSTLRVIVELTTSPHNNNNFFADAVPVTSRQQLIDLGAITARIKLLPLGARTPTRRQLVRWFRFPGVQLAPVAPSEEPEPTGNSLEDDQVKKEAEMQREEERIEKEIALGNSSRFFELRATERRLTRVGMGLRARLRRLDDEDASKSSKNNIHDPVFTRWTVEIFRRVPRPRLECVAIYSRLMSVPSIFKKTTSSLKKKKQQQQDGDDKKKKKDDILDDDDFDEDEDDENSDSLAGEHYKPPVVRNRRLLEAEERFRQNFPGISESIEEAELQLVAVHQLRGVLDKGFALPELVKMSPITAVPSGPSPASIAGHFGPIRDDDGGDDDLSAKILNNTEVFRVQKLPPRGMYVLYMSEERPREHTVDVEIAHADFEFIAPLKLEKRIKSLNMTLHGQYERLPLPSPPFANWTWFDAGNVSLIPLTSESSTGLTNAAVPTNPELALDAAKKREAELRGLLPRLLFQYHNDTQFPGFSILVEQSRPIDDLQVWIRDGKNDTLFLDEERHVPFSVKAHVHDPVSAPLFGWRFALNSQRLFALDKLFVSVSFRLRRASIEHDFFAGDVDGWGGSAVSRQRRRSAAGVVFGGAGGDGKKKAAHHDLSEALAHWSAGREAARHILSWVEDHRWVAVSPTGNVPKNSSSKLPPLLPAFPNYAAVLRSHLLLPQKKNNGNSRLLVDTLAIEPDAHNGAWRLVSKRDLAAGEEIFTLPWSVVLRHTHAPQWVLDIVNGEGFEALLRKHDQYLLNSDHVDLDSAAYFEVKNDEDDEEQGDENKNKNKNNKKKTKSQLHDLDTTVNSSAHLRRVRASLRDRRDIHHTNVKAWTILTLLHWAQVEPELNDVAQSGWGHGAAASLRWHAHYRMFTERIKEDAARRLREFVKSVEEQRTEKKKQEKEDDDDDEELELESSSSQKNKKQKLSHQERLSAAAQRFFSEQLPSKAWTPFTESITRRGAFLADLAAHLLAAHPGLPRTFCGGKLSTEDWFSAAFTIIEARAFLVSGGSKQRAPEWIYVPLLDLATPSSDLAPNIGVGFVSSATTGGVAVQVRAASSSGATIIKSGTPLVFAGWAGGGQRTTAHALEMFGRVTSRMGFMDTASVLLPFGPVLSQRGASKHEESREIVMAECSTRCRRVKRGLPVSVNVNSHQQQHQQQDSSSSSSCSISTCCDLRWLAATLRRRWRQAAAQQLLWNLGDDMLLKKLLYSGSVSQQSPVVVALVDAFKKRQQQQQQQKDDDAAAAASAPPPPLWRDTRQHLAVGTLKTIERHLLEIESQLKRENGGEDGDSQQQQQQEEDKKEVFDISRLSLDERLKFIFGAADSGSVVLLEQFGEDAGIGGGDDENAGVAEHEAKWFGCCFGASSDDDDEKGDL